MSRQVFLGLVTSLAWVTATALGQTPTASPAGLALESVFNPQRAPEHKTMGLLQRSFLDLVESSQKELQVALVVDGTDSMATDIEGVRKALRSLVADLRQYKGDRVSLALVVYRDSGSPSGEVTLMHSQFTADEKAISNSFAKLVPETGAPYFLELPDLGVHEALNKLNWSESPDTSRWLLLFGDAPPYDSDFVDKDASTGARRRFDTDLLVNLAKRKGVQISCVLCTSRDEEKSVYEQVLDKTRKFMNSLATGSGGLMLDLSYPDIRSALVEAARKERVERQRIGTITRDEVDAIRQAAAAAKLPVADGQRLRVAVLPHLPLDQITFDPTHEAVQIAAELRQKFKAIPRAEVASPVDLDRALRRVKSSGVAPEQQLQALAAQLRVDYLVWGSYRKTQGIVSVRSAIYRKTDGQKVTESQALTSTNLPETELASNLVSKWTLTTLDPKSAPTLYAAFAGLRDNATLKAQVLTPVSNSVESRSDLLAGFEALEQGLAYPIGDAAGKALLDQAEQSLARAATEDVRNPFIQMLLASCFFNQSQALLNAGQAEEAKAKSQQFSEALKRAYREREQAQVDLVKTEIEADYNLIVKKDYASAIKLYEALATAPRDATLHTALRAHWVLAGIYSGDWGIDAALIDAKKAKEHLVLVLAHWPDSAEAKFIKTNLRWNDERGGNQFEHFPRVNEVVLRGL
jgi:hypothetical protein